MTGPMQRDALRLEAIAYGGRSPDMPIAERLAREIRRVAELRAAAAAARTVVPIATDVTVRAIDSALEIACRAIGRGDDVTMTDAGRQLEGIQP